VAESDQFALHAPVPGERCRRCRREHLSPPLPGEVSCPAFPGQGIMGNLRGCLRFQVLIQDLLRGPVAEY
jgi:hypothetical protein